MIKIGLTGGLGSGKSLVADIFREKNIPIIDSDQIARELVAPETPQYQQIIDAFGSKLTLDTGQLDRDALAAIVFNDESSRQRLNDILHPAVMKEISAKLAAYQEDNAECVIIDVPLLYETKMDTMMDTVIVVWAPEAICIERLMKYRGFTEQDARARIATQLALNEKKRRADHVIDNSGSIEETQAQCLRFLATIKNAG